MKLASISGACALVFGSALAVPAAAQSSVTISGILDVAVRRVSNDGVGSANAVVSGSNSTSRLNVSVLEDLGGGLKAGATLEHGLLVDTGAVATADKFWDRRATVSLMDDRLGEARLGRDYVPSYSVWTRLDPFSYVGAARSANLISATPTGPIKSAYGSAANTTVRADNTAQWLLPSGLGGLEGGVMLAAGEGRDATAGRGRVVGARLGYSFGDVSIAAAQTETRNSLTTTGSFKDSVLGAQLQLAPVKLGLAWRTFKLADSKQALLMASASSSFGAHEVKASWVRSNFSGRVGSTVIDANDSTQLGLGYVYNLSKRTALYGTLARISNDGAAKVVITDGPAGMAAGGTSKALEAGVRHRF